MPKINPFKQRHASKVNSTKESMNNKIKWQLLKVNFNAWTACDSIDYDVIN